MVSSIPVRIRHSLSATSRRDGVGLKLSIPDGVFEDVALSSGSSHSEWHVSLSESFDNQVPSGVSSSPLHVDVNSPLSSCQVFVKSVRCATLQNLLVVIDCNS
jgi:hypothetical protein